MGMMRRSAAIWVVLFAAAAGGFGQITAGPATVGPPGGGQAATAAQAPATASPATAAPAAAQIQANPALWQVKGVQGTVYLFGSVHVMKKDVHWETPKVADAFKQSGTLYLEVADTSPAAAEKLQPLILSLGLDPEHPLSSKLSKEDVATLDEAMKKMGTAGEAQVETMQPWLVYLTLSVLPAVQAGYDPASGIDRVLQNQADAIGKPVKGFETAEQQLHFMADFTQAQQVALLHESLEELPKSVEKTNDMVADWEKGDVEKIGTEEDGDLRAKHPELYQRLLVGRNEKMAETLAGVLKNPQAGTVFVAVGAAHLAGPDSIQKMLEKQGFVVTRVE
jgi:uncharacterized protein YbaP (TraB family)